MKIKTLFIMLFLLTCFEVLGIELKLENYFFVNNEKILEPSGLVVKDGILYFISDNEDEIIYRAVPTGKNEYSAEKFIKFKLSKKYKKSSKSYEGLGFYKDNFYILSEAEYMIFRVDNTGKTFDYNSILEKGQSLGYFEKKLSGPEGIALTDSGKMVISSQGDYGRLMEADLENGKITSISSIKIKGEFLKQCRGKEASFSDIAFDNNRIYALMKNINTVLILRRKENTYKIEEVYTYGESIKGNEFQYYKDGNHHAEGIAIDKERIYIILDNQKEPRLVDMNDRRPLILIYEKPKELK